MSLLKYLSFLFLISSGCTISQDKFQSRPELVKHWSPELFDEEPAPYPFLVQYQLGKKKLIYVAATHDNKSGNPTFKLIEKALSEEKINFILLEGFQRVQGVSPEPMIKWANKDGENGFFKGGETSFSIQQAVKAGIPFSGAEPDEPSIKKAVLSAGYSEEDLLN